MATPSIRNVSRYAMVMVLLQYMYSYPSWSGNLCIVFVWSVFLLKRLHLTQVKLRKNKNELVEKQRLLSKEKEEIIDLKCKLRKNYDSHWQTKLKLQLSDARLCESNALVNKTQDEISKLKFESQKELSEKKTEALKTTRKLSETQEDLEKLWNRLIKSKDAASRLVLKNAELNENIGRITAMQKTRDVETQMSLKKLRVEISEKETETLKTNKKLSETKKELEILRTESVKSKDAELRLAQMNADLKDRIARITETQKTRDAETQMSLNKLRVEISKKETETLKLNKKLSETKKELEILRTESVKSKDAEIRLAQMNADLKDRIARITATQKRLDVEAAAKLSEMKTKLDLTEATLAFEDARAELERQERVTLCSICLDSDRDTVLVPCGHASTCYTCSLTLHSRDDPECPICRQLVDQIVKIYL